MACTKRGRSTGFIRARKSNVSAQFLCIGLGQKLLEWNPIVMVFQQPRRLAFWLDTVVARHWSAESRAPEITLWFVYSIFASVLLVFLAVAAIFHWTLLGTLLVRDSFSKS